MKGVLWLVAELGEIDKLLLLQQRSMNESFEEVKRRLALIIAGIGNFKYDEITPELEAAVREVAARAKSIDEQVP